jgi:hypothetical protein
MKTARALVWRSLAGLLVALVLAVSTATPALAYGAENYQVGFAGTAVAPQTGFGLGFWGWCTFGGGSGTLPTSGTTGDCNYAFYIHTSSGGVTCEQSVDVTSWTITTGAFGSDFFATGTATVNPASASICFGLFPGVFPSTFTNFDTLIPGAPGHYNLNGFAGFTQLQIQVAAIP